MQNVVFSCIFFSFVAMCLVRVTLKGHLCENFCTFLSIFLYFSMSHPQFGKCVYYRAKFFQSELWQAGWLGKKISNFLMTLNLLRILEQNLTAKYKKWTSWYQKRFRVLGVILHTVFKWLSVTAGKQGLILGADLNYALYCEYYTMSV